jgi:hypothetical protein
VIARRFSVTAGLTLGGAAILFGVAAPPENCPTITPTQTHDAAMLATDWIVDNQTDDGRWLYEYNRSTGHVSPDYNEIRHAGVMSSLYQAAARGHDGALASADRGLEWALDHLVEFGDWVAVTDSRSVSAGTNALLLAGLAERRIDTGDAIHDDLMRRLARFLADQTESSGALLAYWDLVPEQARADTYSIYYTGEAYWALGRLHRLFPDEGWGEVADRMGHYMATVRDDVEDVWPPLADHWAGYGLAETAAFPDRPVGEPFTDAELDFVRRQGGLIGQRVRSISQRFGPWGPAVRGTFTPRGGGYGVFGEGLTGLWRASLLDDRLAPERNDLAERAACISGLAIDAQVDGAAAATHPDPVKARGAWFIDDTTRMDDQQHALSALLMTIPILETVPEPASSGHSAPMWLIWFAVIIATLNPPRLALAAAGSTTRDRLRHLGTGVAVGGTALVGFAALSGWLIDAFDTSRPAMRLGAASLCMLAAAVDFTRPRTPGVEAGSGTVEWVSGAGLMFMKPAVLLAGLSVVADHSLGFYLLVVAVAGVAALADVAVRSTNLGERMLPWFVRLFGAIAFVGGALLVAHAVFDL